MYTRCYIPSAQISALFGYFPILYNRKKKRDSAKIESRSAIDWRYRTIVQIRKGCLRRAFFFLSFFFLRFSSFLVVYCWNLGINIARGWKKKIGYVFADNAHHLESVWQAKRRKAEDVYKYGSGDILIRWRFDQLNWLYDILWLIDPCANEVC